MLFYTEGQKPYINKCKSLGWDNVTIQKYLSYRSGRDLKIVYGRTAFKDSMRSRVYEAESQYEYNVGHGVTFDTIEQCAQYVNKVTRSKLWAELCDGKAKDIAVRHFDSNRWAGMAHGYYINLSSGGYNQYTILHELAHCCGNMHHDISFRRDLLRLVSRFLGRANAKVLKEAFKTHGLKTSMRQSIKEPIDWFESYNKMAKIRPRRLP